MRSKNIYVFYFGIAILYSAWCFNGVLHGANSEAFLGFIGPLLLLPIFFIITIIGTFIFWKDSEAKIALWAAFGGLILLSGFYCVAESGALAMINMGKR